MPDLMNGWQAGAPTSAMLAMRTHHAVQRFACLACLQQVAACFSNASARKAMVGWPETCGAPCLFACQTFFMPSLVTRCSSRKVQDALLWALTACHALVQRAVIT